MDDPPIEIPGSSEFGMMEDELESLKVDNARMREFIRYWSYCTWQGMKQWAPEQRPRLVESLREMKIEGLRNLGPPRGE